MTFSVVIYLKILLLFSKVCISYTIAKTIIVHKSYMRVKNGNFLILTTAKHLSYIELRSIFVYMFYKRN